MRVKKIWIYGKEFKKWIQILIKNPEPCVINGSKTPPYFKLERGTRQVNPISAYLFIIALEIVFPLIEANPDIERLQLFSHTFLYSAYTSQKMKFSIRDFFSKLDQIRRKLLNW